MADMRDYLELRGDLTLAERPFNDVDNLVLATMAYLDFSDIVPGEEEGGSVTVRAACEALLARAGEDLAPHVRSMASIDLRFVRALAASERFGTALLSAYADVRDSERVLQFSAVTAALSDGSVYVAFRGTDTTLTGWRENFILSFAVTQAQRAAADYLERAIGRAPAEAPVLVGGHSKGGNLAAYAAATCPEALRPRIARVYSNDGPGMDPTVVAVGCRDVMGERYVRILPSYSVVGRFFSDDAPCTVVKSSASRTLQHDPMSWQVRATGFDEADGFDPECLVVDRAFSSWLGKLDPKDRELLTNQLFDALEAGGATFFEDLWSPVAAQKTLAALADTDPRTGEMMRDLVGELVGTTAEATRDAVAGAVADAAADMAARARARLEALVVRPDDAADDHAHDGDDDGAQDG